MSMIRSSLACLLLMLSLKASCHSPTIDHLTLRDLVVTSDLLSPESEQTLRDCLEDRRRCRNQDGSWKYPLQSWLRFLSLDDASEATKLLRVMRSFGDDDHEFVLVDARLAAASGRPEALIGLSRANRFRKLPDLDLLAKLGTPEAASELLSRIDGPDPAQRCAAVSLSAPYLGGGDSFHRAFEARIIKRMNESTGTATECLVTALTRESFEITAPMQDALADAFLRLLADSSASVRERTLVTLQTAWPLLRDVRVEEAMVRMAIAESSLDPQDRRGALYLASLHRLLPPELTEDASASDSASAIACCTPSLAELLVGRGVDHPAWSSAMKQTTLAELWARVARFDAAAIDADEARQWRTHPRYRDCRACLIREREVRGLPAATPAELPDAQGWSAMSRLILIRQGLLAADEATQQSLWREALDDDHAWRKSLAVVLASGVCGLSLDPKDGQTPLDMTAAPTAEIAACLKRLTDSTKARSGHPNASGSPR